MVAHRWAHEDRKGPFLMKERGGRRGRAGEGGAMRKQSMETSEGCAAGFEGGGGAVSHGMHGPLTAAKARTPERTYRKNRPAICTP